MSEIKISAGFEREKIWKRGDSVRHLVVELEPSEQETRPVNSSVNVGLVIDASGSMAGEWIESAKRAAIGIVEGLTSTDTVSIVSFASEVQIHCSGLAGTRSGKQEAIEKISMLDSRDTTDLSSGWLSGAECVAGVMAASKSSRISSVVVLSDGHANRGITDPRVLATHANELLKRGIISSAVGIGANYSNLQLQAIADNGGGLVHHASRPEEIVEVVVAELGELRQVVAESIELEISGNRPVDIECYSPFARQPNIGDRKQGVSFSLGSLTAGASRTAVFKINTPAAGESEKIEFAITARWRNPSDQTVTGYADTEACLYFAGGKANLLQQVDQDKARLTARAWLAKSIREAIEFNSQGRYQDASNLMLVQGEYFKRFCALIDDGESLILEWDRAAPHMDRQIEPLMAKETSMLYAMKAMSMPDRREFGRGYRAWSKVE